MGRYGKDRQDKDPGRREGEDWREGMKHLPNLSRALPWPSSLPKHPPSPPLKSSPWEGVPNHGLLVPTRDWIHCENPYNRKSLVSQLLQWPSQVFVCLSGCLGTRAGNWRHCLLLVPPVLGYNGYTHKHHSVKCFKQISISGKFILEHCGIHWRSSGKNAFKTLFFF